MTLSLLLSLSSSLSLSLRSLSLQEDNEVTTENNDPERMLLQTRVVSSSVEVDSTAGRRNTSFSFSSFLLLRPLRCVLTDSPLAPLPLSLSSRLVSLSLSSVSSSSLFFSSSLASHFFAREERRAQSQM